MTCSTSYARSARLGKHVHLHLHDGHPLIPGLADHFTFLTRLPVPFSYQGRRSLSMMYGPGGLASIVSAATGRAARSECPSRWRSTRSKAGCRSPTQRGCSPHWRDLTNAERMNYWLSVLGENALLVSPHLAGR